MLSSEKPLDSLGDEGEEEGLRIMMKKVAPHLDIDTRDDNGATPLMLAALNGHCSIVNILLSYSATVSLSDVQG